jgi:hypothetical protein
MADSKKCVLYLSRELLHNPHIEKVLGSSYEIEQYLCENIEELPEILSAPFGGKKYDAVITCMPFLSNSYEASILAIAKAKRRDSTMPIIVYTPCDDDVMKLAACKSIDAIVSNNGKAQWEKDAERLKAVLDSMLGKKS